MSLLVSAAGGGLGLSSVAEVVVEETGVSPGVFWWAWAVWAPVCSLQELVVVAGWLSAERSAPLRVPPVLRLVLFRLWDCFCVWRSAPPGPTQLGSTFVDVLRASCGCQTSRGAAFWQVGKQDDFP